MTDHTEKIQGRCIFCGRTGLSKEHIWSDWLKALVPRNDEHGEYWGSMHRDAHSRDVEWTVGPSSTARQGSVLQRRVRNVCERHCNNGWMSRVVGRAKPHIERMMLGSHLQMNLNEQTDVAAWIGITTVMQEFANRSRITQIPREDRSSLMANEAPPLSWSIWAGRYVGQWWAPFGHYHIPMSYVKQHSPEEPAPPRGALQLTTFTLRALIVHVFTSTQSEMVNTYRSYVASVADSAKLLQLWPIACNSLDWPPASALTDEDVDTLAFDWIERKWGALGLPGRPHERDVLRVAKAIASLVQAKAQAQSGRDGD
jgi:hypothetical protein